MHFAPAGRARRDPFPCRSRLTGWHRPRTDLSHRAEHPPEQLCTLHGSLFDIKCSNEDCEWIQRGNFDDPFCPSLAPASEDPPRGEPLPLLDPYHRIKHVPEEDLPKCPQCQSGLQRPGVVWFGEALDENMMEGINDWITKGKIVRFPCIQDRNERSGLTHILFART